MLLQPGRPTVSWATSTEGWSAGRGRDCLWEISGSYSASSLFSFLILSIIIIKIQGTLLSILTSMEGFPHACCLLLSAPQLQPTNSKFFTLTLSEMEGLLVRLCTKFQLPQMVSFLFRSALVTPGLQSSQDGSACSSSELCSLCCCYPIVWLFKALVIQSPSIHVQSRSKVRKQSDVFFPKF